MEKLLQKIEKNWVFCQKNLGNKYSRRRSKIPSKVIVCVSGGSDSVAMLHLLQRLKKLLCLELSVLYFNHRIRSESDQEQEFVKSLAKKYKIPFLFKIKNDLKPHQKGLQEVAREWRIRESLKILESLGGDYIATGHHADDQVETLLLKLLRGAHISNLKGMHWINPPFIRPLLNCNKLELQDYLKRNNFSWLEDSSNQSKKYLRNRVRLELIPLLEELTRDGLQSHILDLIEQSNLLRNWLNLGYDEWMKKQGKKRRHKSEILFVSDLEKENKILQQEILYNFIFFRTGQSLSYRKLQNIFELILKSDETWAFSLSKSWEIYHFSGEIILRTK